MQIIFSDYAMANQIDFKKNASGSKFQYAIIYRYTHQENIKTSRVAFSISQQRIQRDNQLVPQLTTLAKKINAQLPIIAKNEAMSIIDTEQDIFLRSINSRYQNALVHIQQFTYPFEIILHCPNTIITYDVQISQNSFLQKMNTTTCRMATRNSNAFNTFQSQVSQHVLEVQQQLPTGSRYTLIPQGNSFQINSQLQVANKVQMRSAQNIIASSNRQITEWQHNFDSEYMSVASLFSEIQVAQKQAIDTLHARTENLFSKITQKTNKYMQRVYKDNFIIARSKGNIMQLQLDYVALIADSLPSTKSIAQSFDRKANPRKTAQEILYFLQSIPYSRLHGRDIVGYKGFLPPTSLFDKNKGDCDSKSVAFISMLENLYPNIPKIMVLIPGHAFVGLGVETKNNEQVINHKGRGYVIAETAGPGLLAIGKASEQTRKAIQQNSIEEIIHI